MSIFTKLIRERESSWETIDFMYYSYRKEFEPN